MKNDPNKNGMTYASHTLPSLHLSFFCNMEVCVLLEHVLISYTGGVCYSAAHEQLDSPRVSHASRTRVLAHFFFFFYVTTNNTIQYNTIQWQKYIIYTNKNQKEKRNK